MEKFFSLKVSPDSKRVYAGIVKPTKGGYLEAVGVRHDVTDYIPAVIVMLIKDEEVYEMPNGQIFKVTVQEMTEAEFEQYKLEKEND